MYPMGSWLTVSWDTIAHGVDSGLSLPNAEVNRIVEKNARDLVLSSGKRMTLEQARTIARADLEKQRGAYRKDGGPEPGKPGLATYAAIGGGAVLLFLLMRR